MTNYGARQRNARTKSENDLVFLGLKNIFKNNRFGCEMGKIHNRKLCRKRLV